MTDADYERKLDEVDRLLNDPDVPMEPGRIWSLLAEIALWKQAEPSELPSIAGPLSRTPGCLPARL